MATKTTDKKKGNPKNDNPPPAINRVTDLTGDQTLKFNINGVSGSVLISCNYAKCGNSVNLDYDKLPVENIGNFLNLINGACGSAISPKDKLDYYTHLHDRFVNAFRVLKGKSFSVGISDLSKYAIQPTMFWVVEDATVAGTYNLVPTTILSIYKHFCGEFGQLFLSLPLALGQAIVESLSDVVGRSAVHIHKLYSPRHMFKRSNADETIMGIGQVTGKSIRAGFERLAAAHKAGTPCIGLRRMYKYLINLNKFYFNPEIDFAKISNEKHLALMECDAGYNILCHLVSLYTKAIDASISSNTTSAKAIPTKLYDYSVDTKIPKDFIIDTYIRYHGESCYYGTPTTSIDGNVNITIPRATSGDMDQGLNVVYIGIQYAYMIDLAAQRLFNVVDASGNVANPAWGTIALRLIPDKYFVGGDKISMFYNTFSLFGRQIATTDWKNDIMYKGTDVFQAKKMAGMFCNNQVRWTVQKNEHDYIPYVYKATGDGATLIKKKTSDSKKEDLGDTKRVSLTRSAEEFKLLSNEEKAIVYNNLAESIATTKVLSYESWANDNKNLFTNAIALDFQSRIHNVNLAGIIGLPVRYSALSDLTTRDYWNVIDPDDNLQKLSNIYGRNYAENTVLYGNMVTITPCRPQFMGNNDGKTVASVLGATAGIDEKGNMTADDKAKLNEAMVKAAENAKTNTAPTLFTAKPAGDEYSRIVSFALRSAAMIFGISEDDYREMMDTNELEYIGDMTKDNPFDYFSVEKSGSNIFSDIYLTQTAKTTTDTTTKISKLLKNMYSIAIYNSGLLESQETFSNNVGPSFIDQLVNLPMSEIARDANFLLNEGGAWKGETDGKNNNEMINTLNTMSDSRNKTDATQAMKDGLGGVMGIMKSASSKMFGSIKLPKIWKSSEFGKTYNMKIKLSSPSPDYRSVFKYIIAELVRLMPLWSPQQWGYYQDAVTSPFIIQFYNRGTSSIEYGMVTGVEIDRHADTMGLNGLPTEIDVNLTITDLFPFFSLPSKENDYNAARYYASGFLSYISTYAGVPLFRGDTAEFASSKLSFYKGKVVAIENAPGKKVNSSVSEWLYTVSNAFR